MTVTLDDIRDQLDQIISTLNSRIASLTISADQMVVLNGLSDVDNRLGLIQAGEFRTGNGKIPGDGFTGGRFGYPGFEYGADTYFLAGVLNDTLQVGLSLTNGKIFAGGGDVIIDSQGIWIDNQQAAFGFEDTGGNRFNIYLSSDALNRLRLTNQTGHYGILMRVDSTSHATLDFYVEEDAQAERLKVELYPGGYGARLNVANEIFIDGEGVSGGETRIAMFPTTNTPANLGSSSHGVNIYMRNDKLVFQFNDGGTVRYKYLDLTGTGVTWVHDTVAP